MSITGYLSGARQRLCEFGAFVEREPDTLPPRLQMWADWAAERVEPGLTTWVAFVANPDDARVAGLLEELGAMARARAGGDRTDVQAILVVVLERPLTREQYFGWQQWKSNAGPVRVVPWVVDLVRNQLFEHEGLPHGLDPDLAMLVGPETLPEHVVPAAASPAPGRGPGGFFSELRLLENWVTSLLLVVIAGVWVAMSVAGGAWDATSQNSELLYNWGAISRPRLWMTGEYWRLLSAAFLHIGIEHLLMNALSLFFVGRVVEELYGRWRLLLIFLVSAVAGSVLSAVLGPPSVIGAGASGAVLGLVGAILWHRVALPAGHRISWRLVVVALALDLGAGFALKETVDNWAHLGGMLGGFVTAFAVGVPSLAGLPAPRLRLPRAVHALLVAALLGATAATLAGMVELPGAGRELARAFEAHDAGRYAEAEAGLRQAMRLQPGEPFLRYLLTHTLYQQGKCQEAQVESSILLSEVPDDADIRELDRAIKACLRR